MEYEYWSPEPVRLSKTEKRPREPTMSAEKQHSGVSLFCQSTSIRGMAKIAKSQTRFLKTLWLLFIVFMTAGLFASATLLVLDFLNYDVGLHTSNLGIPSEFPALTICHHHPFSSNAYKLWSKKLVMSPTEFNQKLRGLSRDALLQNQGIDAARASLFYDTIDVYYQNLKYSDAIALGHNWTIYRNCMTVQGSMFSYEDDCQKLDRFVMKRLSHFKYFNCYTFEAINSTVAEQNRIFSVVVKMGPKPNFSHFEQAFLMDIFEQARGLRVVVHERGTYPDMESEGIQVEPGKYTEITYEPIRLDKLNTPRKPCADSNSTLTDLGRSYNYVATQCEKYHDQFLFNDRCRCIYALYMRPNFPSDDLKYCGSIDSIGNHVLNDRVNCLGNIMANKKRRDKEPDAEGVTCRSRCRVFEFRNQISITKWRATHWQLYWLRYQHRLMESLNRKVHDFLMVNKTLNISETSEFANLSRYLDSPNLTHITTDTSTDDDLISGEENFAYVRLKRKNDITIVMTEKLILSLNVLMSRVGGLCSLSIGLNTAFVVELIEFLYLYCRAQAQRHNEPKSGRRPRGIKDASDKDDGVEFSIFESPRGHIATDLYTSRNGRPPPTRPRMLRADYSMPMNPYGKESSSSAFLG